MPVDELLRKLWADYSSMNPQAEAIHKALEARVEKVVNDHIAFRTFNIPKVGIEVMARPFLDLGWHPAEGPGYHFSEKKLFARHFEHADPQTPKVFISELKVEEFSKGLQRTIRELVGQVPESLTAMPDFLTAGTPWKKIGWQTYQNLLKESEYAAWMAAFGFRVNHFTVFYNALKTFKDFAELNSFIKSLGFQLNSTGGEIKGSKKVFLEQSSTLACPVEVTFADCRMKIPGCYYEFARRYPMPNGNLFQGFLPDSADKIYREKSPNEVSWYRSHLEKSLELILQTGIDKKAPIIDVGGGTSTLVDDLLANGFECITVMDTSSQALDISKTRLGKQAAKVIWMEGDITCVGLLPHAYDLWHDRAVFHFLTCPEDRRKYVDRLSQSLKPDGHVIVATFGLNGPSRCSGLDVVRYSPEGLLTELGQDFSLIESFEEDHKTPGGTLQQFIYCHFIRGSSNTK